jgi:hypothetical protein
MASLSHFPCVPWGVLVANSSQRGLCCCLGVSRRKFRGFRLPFKRFRSPIAITVNHEFWRMCKEMSARRSHPHYFPAADYTAVATTTVPLFVQDTENLLRLPVKLFAGASFSVYLVFGIRMAFFSQVHDLESAHFALYFIPCRLQIRILVPIF